MADEVTGQQAQTAGEAGTSTNAEGQGGTTATQTAGQQQAATTTTERTFSQADLDRIVRERLAEEKKRAEQRASDEDAKKRGDFEKLLTSRDAELQAASTERDTLKARYEEMSAAFTGVVERETKALKELDGDLLTLMPEGDAVKQLKWLTNAVEMARKRKTTGGLPPAGGRNPGAQQSQGPTEEDRKRALAHMATRF